MKDDFIKMDDLVMALAQINAVWPSIKIVRIPDEPSILILKLGLYSHQMQLFRCRYLSALEAQCQTLVAYSQQQMAPLYERQLEQSKWADDNSVVHSFKLIDEWTRPDKKHLIDVYNEQDRVLFTLMYGKEEE